MTDQLAQLRAEIEAEVAERKKRVVLEADCISILTDVLRRMDRIEAECPKTVAPEASRAPRRDLQGAIMAAVSAAPLGLRSDVIRAAIGAITEGAFNRVLRALVDSGKLVSDGTGVYRRAGALHAVENAAE